MMDYSTMISKSEEKSSVNRPKLPDKIIPFDNEGTQN